MKRPGSGILAVSFIALLVFFLISCGASSGGDSRSGDPKSPDMSAYPGDHDFGSVVAGGSSSPLEVTISNEGHAALNVSDIALSEGTDYTLDLNGGSNPCAVATPAVAAAETCTVEVIFSPVTVGLSTDTLDISSDDPNEPEVSIALSGTGLAVPVPDIAVTPENHNFGDIVVGGSSSPFEVTVSNEGSATLNVSDIALVSGTNYTLDLHGGSHPCNMASTIVVAGGSCTVEVIFSPAAEGPGGDTLEISSNDPDVPVVSIALSGTGVIVPIPGIAVDPKNHNFGDIVVGDSSSPFEVTISNEGSTARSVSNIALVSGTNYTLDLHGGSNPCSMVSPSLVAGANCTVEVTFSPTSEGPLTDKLNISSDDPGNPVLSANLSGTGLAIPTTKETAKLTASDAEVDDLFAWAVAISNTTVVVGALYEDTGGSNAGAAYVYDRNPVSGAWEEVDKLMASDPGVEDLFGFSVSVSGNTVIVGAKREDTAADDAGAAYVFERDTESGVWPQVAKLMASDAEMWDEFGTSVSVSNTTAFVGAPLENTVPSDSGAVYVFERNSVSGVWEEVAKLTPSDASSGDNFGISVSVDGTTAVVGAFGADTGGAAYVFERNPVSGVWEEVAKLTSSDVEALDFFGYSVSVSGTTAFVGAPGEDPGGVLWAGAAYVFERDPVSGTWEQVAKLTAKDASSQDDFGDSVSVSGTTAVIGAPKEDPGSVYCAGSAYVFRRNPVSGAWEQVAKLSASDADPEDDFGLKVSVDGTTAVIGAESDDERGKDAGAAYVFE